LENGTTPTKQSSNDLICSQVIEDSTRTTTCVRYFNTEDDDDFNDFNLGTMQMIHATGNIKNGELQQHSEANAAIFSIDMVGFGCQNLSDYAYYGGASVGVNPDKKTVLFYVDIDCDTVHFQVNDTYGDYYTSFGFGGNYTVSGLPSMNGYAVIVANVSGGLGLGFDTILESGITPEPKENSEIYNISQLQIDDARITVLSRPYITDNIDDFQSFQLGDMKIIYAFGDEIDSELMGHMPNNAGVLSLTVYGNGCDRTEERAYKLPTPAPTPPTLSPTYAPTAKNSIKEPSESAATSNNNVLSLSFFMFCLLLIDLFFI
jgi:hypothetical protein